MQKLQVVPPAGQEYDLPVQPLTVEDIATELAERSKYSVAPPEPALSVGFPNLEEVAAEETEEWVLEPGSSGPVEARGERAAEHGVLEVFRAAVLVERDNMDDFTPSMLNPHVGLAQFGPTCN